MEAKGFCVASVGCRVRRRGEKQLQCRRRRQGAPPPLGLPLGDPCLLSGSITLSLFLFLFRAENLRSRVFPGRSYLVVALASTVQL